MAKKNNEAGGGFDMLSDEKFIQTLPGEAPSVVNTPEKEEKADEPATENVAAAAPVKPAEVKKEPTADELEAALAKREKEAAAKEEKKDDGTKDTKTDKDGEDKTPEGGEKKPDEKKVDGEKKPDDTEQLTFDNPDDVKPPANAAGESYGWKELAKEKFSLDIAEDTEEAFTEAVNKKVDINLSKHPPETQRLYKFTEAGGSADDFIEPFKKVDNLLNLSAEELVRKDYEQRKWSQEKIDARIQFLEESGGLDGEHEILREKLNGYREGVKNQIIEDRIKAKEIADQKAANAFKEEAKHIKTQLDTRKEFMETPLNDKNREFIHKKYENGDYDKEFKNPEKIADFLLWAEFGKKGQANLRQKIEREVKKSYQAERHNVPPADIAAAGGMRSTTSGHDPVGNFDMLEKEKV